MQDIRKPPVLCNRCHLQAYISPITFVCVDCFQIHDMADDMVLVSNAITTQHVPSLSGNVQSLATAVSLQHGDHLWGCPKDMKRQKCTVSLLNRIGLAANVLLCYILMRYLKTSYFFSSISLPNRKQDCNPMVISVSMSAIFFCISWFLARGTPNCILWTSQYVNKL